MKSTGVVPPEETERKRSIRKVLSIVFPAPGTAVIQRRLSGDSAEQESQVLNSRVTSIHLQDVR